MRNLFLPLIFVAVLLTMFFVFIQTGLNKGRRYTKTVVIDSRLWPASEKQSYVRREVIAPFIKKNRIPVKLNTIDERALYKKAAARGETQKVLTDILAADASVMREWAKKGLLTDLSAETELWAGRDYFSKFLEMSEVDGKRYFVPVNAYMYFLCINKKALPYKPADVSINALTWEELARWSNAVSEKEGGRFILTGATRNMIYPFGCLALSYGADFPDLASKGARQAWRVLLTLRKGFCSSLKAYSSVEPPMMRGEAWFAVTRNTHAGRIYASNPAQFIIAPAPKGPDGRGSIAGVSGFALLKGTLKKKRALKFLAYVSIPKVQLKLAEGTGAMPPLRTPQQRLKENGAGKMIEISLKALDRYRFAVVPRSSDGEAVRDVFDQAFKKIVLTDGKVDPLYLAEQQKKIDALVIH